MTPTASQDSPKVSHAPNGKADQSLMARHDPACHTETAVGTRRARPKGTNIAARKSRSCLTALKVTADDRVRRPSQTMAEPGTSRAQTLVA